MAQSSKLIDRLTGRQPSGKQDAALCRLKIWTPDCCHLGRSGHHLGRCHRGPRRSIGTPRFARPGFLAKHPRNDHGRTDRHDDHRHRRPARGFSRPDQATGDHQGPARRPQRGRRQALRPGHQEQARTRRAGKAGDDLRHALHGGRTATAVPSCMLSTRPRLPRTIWARIASSAIRCPKEPCSAWSA
jgi:hypothetical protein